MKKELMYQATDGKTCEKKLRIIHFNDAYNIESRKVEPCGGASRFVSAIEQLNAEEPAIVLFSGDVFSPSTLSVLLKGKQMVDVLNAANVRVACIGNHDFDFGVDHLVDLMKLTSFPWLMSNAVDLLSGKPLAEAHTKHIIEFNGLRIGFIGLIEEDWIATLSTIDFDEVLFEDFCDAGRRLANELRTKDKVDLVIALTHMRIPNDEKLAREVPEIDLVLGGHDHDYNIKQADGRFVIKSGNDFRELSVVELCIDSSNKSFVNKIERYEIDSSITENQKIKEMVHAYFDELEKELDVTLGIMNSDLDGRFIKIRSEETTLGNFVCDTVLEAVNADCVLINSGTFRSDTLHPQGEFKVRDLKTILPFLDTIIVIRCTGKQIHLALENGVSQYPKLEGRFPQVAGLKFTFDPRKPSGKRVDPQFIRIQNRYLDFQKQYSVAVKSFLREGKDGYDMFKDCPFVIDEENGPQLILIVENHFKTIEQLKEHGASDDTHPHHRPSIVPIAKRNKLLTKLVQDPNSLHYDQDENHNDHHLHKRHPSHMSFHTAASVISKTLAEYHHITTPNLTHDDLLHIKESNEYKAKIHELEEKSMMLKPVVEGRILRVTDDKLLEPLIRQREEFAHQKSISISES